MEGLEEANVATRLPGSRFRMIRGSGSYADEEVKRQGKRSMRLEGAGESPNRRIMQQVGCAQEWRVTG